MNRPPQRFRIGLVQMSCGEDPAGNLERACTLVGDAAARGAQIVCLQELFRSRYFCSREDPARFDLAEPVPGPSTERLARVAKDNGVVVIASLFERRAAGVYHNTAAVLDADGSLVGLYRKMHIPDDPLYFEKYYFAPGDLGFRAFDTRFGRIGVLVCWDQWYPEAARLVALAGASVLFYPTAIGWHPSEKAEFGAAQRSAWQTVQRGHAIANGIYVAAVNRVGHEKPAGPPPLGPPPLGPPPKDGGAVGPRSGGGAEGPSEVDGLEFWGGSFVSDPFGRVLVEAGAGEEVLVAECDLGRLEEIRRNWPFLRDRRIDAYGGITRRFLDEQ